MLLLKTLCIKYLKYKKNSSITLYELMILWNMTAQSGFIHLIFPVRAALPFVNLMCLASSVIRFQLFLAVQSSTFFCFILQTGVSCHIILMYSLNYEHTGLYYKQFYSLLQLFFLLFPYSS